MKILGFGHQKRVGKDEATRYAVAHARQLRPDLRIAVLSFGSVIKEVSKHLYNWGGLMDAPYYENHPSEIEEILPAIGKSPRQIWDTIGLAGRDISDRTWVELAMQDVDAHLLVCKDVRGPAEFDLIKMNHGLLVKIVRPGAPQGGPVDRLLGDRLWDHVITNDGTLRTLNLIVKDLVKDCLEKWF